MKPIFPCALLLCISMIIPGCGSGDPDEKKKHTGLPPGEAGIVKLRVVASGSFPPYYYQDDADKVVGMSAGIVNEALSRAGFRQKMELFPVKRAFMLAEAKEPVLLFALFRTPEREKKFKWVAPVTPKVKSVLFRLAKRTDISLHSLDDAKRYRTGVVRGNNLHTLLTGKGFRDGQEIEPEMSNDVNMKKMFAGRIDLCAGRELPFITDLARSGYDARDVATALVLEEDRAWMAFSLSTPDEIVERIRAAYRSMESDGTVSRIFSRTGTSSELR